MMRVELFRIFTLLAMLLAPASARAAFCELPHERLRPECSENADSAISAVQKKKDVGSIVQEYKQKSRQSSLIVERANEEYEAYLEKHPRRR